MRTATQVAFLAAALTLSVGNTVAVPFSFTNLYDSSGPFNSFGAPAINNSGTVAFSASLDTGESGIFTGSGGPTTTIADTSGPSNSVGGYSLNNAGTVAFTATLDTGGAGVFTGSGGHTTTIADGESFPEGFVAVFDSPSLNDRGTVAFFFTNETSETSGITGIFTSNGGPITTIVDNSNESFQFAGSPSLNNSGTVAFEAFFDGPGIFTGSGGPITTIATERMNGLFFNIIGSPSLNDSGTVAFAVARALEAVGTVTDSGPVAFAPPPGCEEEPDPSLEEAGILAGSGGPVTIIARCFGLSFSLIPSLNNSGTVAFLADASIRTGPDPVADKVISAGDALFGSTVAGVFMNKESLNDADQIAFFYELADGRTGIARADPLVIPEPGTVSLLLAALISAGLWSRDTSRAGRSYFGFGWRVARPVREPTRLRATRGAFQIMESHDAG